MARVFKRKDRLNAMSEINITSLLDLVFCLLIIFMITATVIEQTVPINLPTQPRDPAAGRDSKQKYVAVTIDKQGHLFFEKTPVTPEDLRAQLKVVAAQPDPPVIAVREDPSVNAQQQADVLTMIKQAGLTKLSLDLQAK
jgi:biopolymer transport protein ExbD